MADTLGAWAAKALLGKKANPVNPQRIFTELLPRSNLNIADEDA